MKDQVKTEDHVVLFILPTSAFILSRILPVNQDARQSTFRRYKLSTTCLHFHESYRSSAGCEAFRYTQSNVNAYAKHLLHEEHSPSSRERQGGSRR